MTRIFRFSSIFLSISLIFVASNAYSDESGLAPIGTSENRKDSILLKFADRQSETVNSSGYQSPDLTINGTTILGDYEAVLPWCGSAHEFGCISMIEAKTATQKLWEQLTPGEYFWNGPIANITTDSDGTSRENLWSQWEGNKTSKLPPSGKVQLFESKSHPHKGGSKYAVKAVMSGNKRGNGEYAIDRLNLSVTPVKPTRYDVNNSGTREIRTTDRYLFPQEVQFRVSVKLGPLYSQLNGWFFGRVSNAAIQLNPQQQSLIISGEPSIVPVHTGYVPTPVPDEYKDYFGDLTIGTSGYLPSFIFSTSSGESVKRWLQFSKFLEPTANYERQLWEIGAIARQSYLGNKFGNCLEKKSGVVGMLNSNATAFDPLAPTWNSKDSSLTYQVAGPTLLSDGRKNSGYYLLAIRSDVASCLWNSNLKSAKATIEITNGNGSLDRQIAATTFSEQAGWVYFAATGFHFSAPKISVKLNSEKIIKITCLKGKTKKVISGTNPSCPSGYKKA